MSFVSDLTPIIIVPAFIYGTYSIIKLFVQRKERMSIIEKLSEGIDPSIINQFGTSDRLKIKIENKSAWTIRIGFLLFGIGLGIALVSLLDAFTADAAALEYASLDWDKINLINHSPVRQAFNVLYPAAAALFGGIGLIIAFFMERKYKIKDDK